VYYESLCPESKKFITEQLAPVWRDFRGAVKVKLVPYGKSTVSIKTWESNIPRFKNNLLQSKSNLTIHSSGPHSMTIKIYNKLPKNLKAETNWKKFTNSLKKILIKKAYYSINEYFEKNNLWMSASLLFHCYAFSKCMWYCYLYMYIMF
jgi:hypothetical protein